MLRRNAVYSHCVNEVNESVLWICHDNHLWNIYILMLKGYHGIMTARYGVLFYLMLHYDRCLKSINRWSCTITEKAPTRTFSWLKAPTSAFTFKTLLRHYAKRSLTPRSFNMKLGPGRKSHKGRAAIIAYNQEKVLVGAFSVIVQLHRWIDLRH